MSLIGKLVDKLLKQGSITLLMPGKAPRTFGPGGGQHLTLRLADQATALKIARNPRLGVGEAYMDGRLTVEDGTILELMRLIVGANPWEAGGSGRKALRKGKKLFGALWRRNPAKRARKNVAHHYDIGNDLYRMFLDDDLQYSCGYFPSADASLEAAQAAKKAHIAAKLDLRPGQRVLDIGCGWGGLALHLHRIADVDVVGITLSTEQLAIARARAAAEGVADRVSFELRDYRAIGGRFDRIVSVGMFEHVGPPHYRTFFERCRDLLTEDGVMLLHTIGRADGPAPTDRWLARYIFPGGYIPALSQIAPAIEQSRLWITDIEMLRLHYAHTLAHWYDRVAASRDAIVALYDERFYRMWTFYLAGALVAFRHDAHLNFQIQLSRRRETLPLTRDYMVDVERGDGTLEKVGSIHSVCS